MNPNQQYLLKQWTICPQHKGNILDCFACGFVGRCQNYQLAYTKAAERVEELITNAEVNVRAVMRCYLLFGALKELAEETHAKWDD